MRDMGLRHCLLLVWQMWREVTEESHRAAAVYMEASPWKVDKPIVTVSPH